MRKKTASDGSEAKSRGTDLNRRTWHLKCQALPVKLPLERTNSIVIRTVREAGACDCLGLEQPILRCTLTSTSRGLS